MYIHKSFAGITTFGMGPETEPGSSGNDSLDKALTDLTYALFDLQSSGAQINYDALVEAIDTGMVDYSQIIKMGEKKEAENLPPFEKVGSALNRIADESGYNKKYVEWMEEALSSYRNMMSPEPDLNIESGLAKYFADISSAKLGSSTITDKEAFKQSLIQAVIDSDQGGLESAPAATEPGDESSDLEDLE